MSCLALKLTCKTRPLWLQTVLQNDVTPEQYETNIACLELEIEWLRHEAQRLRLEQKMVCGRMTWLEYSSANFPAAQLLHRARSDLSYYLRDTERHPDRRTLAQACNAMQQAESLLSRPLPEDYDESSSSSED